MAPRTASNSRPARASRCAAICAAFVVSSIVAIGDPPVQARGCGEWADGMTRPAAALPCSPGTGAEALLDCAGRVGRVEQPETGSADARLGARAAAELRDCVLHVHLD